MVNIILGIVVPVNNTNAPIKYGFSEDLYSAFSSTLPNIYFIPIAISITTETITPIVCIIPKMLLAVDTKVCEVAFVPL